MSSTSTPAIPSSPEVILAGVFESSVGLLLGATLDTIAPSPDASKGWTATSIEAFAQLGINAVVIQAAGAFILTKISPSNSTSGILLGWGMFLGQPGLMKKIKYTVDGVKIGVLNVASDNAAAIAKSIKN